MNHLILAEYCPEQDRVLITQLATPAPMTLDYVREHLGATKLAVHTIASEVCLIVDEDGVKKSGNPVIEIQWRGCKGLHVAGNAIFAKRVLHNGQFNAGSFREDEILELLGDYALGPVGEIK